MALSLLSAREYRLQLEAGPEEQQVFYLELGKTGADSATFELKTPDGTPVPFSFDMRLSYRTSPGKYYRPADGFYSKETAPAAENRFRHPGWLSFHGIPGVSTYVFSFRDGAAETLERPNPALRPYWMELVKDPLFKEERYLRGGGNRTMLPGGGVQFDKPLQLVKGAGILDERMGGRRIVALMRCEGNFTYFGTKLNNDIIRKIGAISCYFTPIDGQATDTCVDGRLARIQTFDLRHFLNLEFVKGPSKVYRYHIQLPPAETAAGVLIRSDIYCQCDTIVFEPHGLGYENTLPFSSDGIQGYRVGCLKGEPIVQYRLMDAANRAVKEGKALQLKLDQVPLGTYTLHTELLVDGVNAEKKDRAIRVLPNPFAQ